jgi:hypothetical protein
MAKFIFHTDNSLFAIAANQEALDKLNIIQSQYTIVDGSDDLFNKVRLNKSWAQFDGTNIIENSFLLPGEVSRRPFMTESNLKNYIDQIKNIINYYLQSNTSTEIQNYLTFIESIQTSSISFPMTQTFEEYVESQGITAINSLQIR